MAPKAKASKTQEDQPQIGLTDLRPAKGAVRTKLRVGRGRASGAGKTSNRGHNGEGQRSGNSTKRGFEGGQMPGYRRMPKMDGFELINRRNWLELNVGDLSRVLLDGETELTYDLLRERGFLKQTHDGVRLLGNGDVSAKVKVEAHHITPGARQKLEAAGGSVTLLGQSAE